MIHLRLLFIIWAMPVMLIAQVTIGSGDMPQAGDTIRLSTSYDFSGLDYTSTGTGYNWDFTALQPVMQRVDTFVTVQETPWIYQLVFFLYANLAKKQIEFDQIPGFEVTDVYEYYKNQNSDFRSVGFGITLNGIPLPNKYNDPDIVYQFPLNYGNVDSSFAVYGIDIPGIGYTGGWKKRINYVDGWGTIATPYGNFESIRIKSEVLQFDSLYIDSLGFGFPIYRQFTEYKWLGEDMGLPLLKVTDDGLLPSYVYIDSVRTLTTGWLNENNLQNAVNLYPNPTNGLINITFVSPLNETTDVSILTPEGKLVYSQQLSRGAGNNGLISINLKEKGLLPGVYFAVIRQQRHHVLKKIIIN